MVLVSLCEAQLIYYSACTSLSTETNFTDHDHSFILRWDPLISHSIISKYLPALNQGFLFLREEENNPKISAYPFQQEVKAVRV